MSTVSSNLAVEKALTLSTASIPRRTLLEIINKM
jgi:hypothetical protein